MEYVNLLTGFRVDGRRPNEMRQVKGEVGVVARADGSRVGAVRDGQHQGHSRLLRSSRGTRSACINTATLALADAGIPMRDIVTSCSAGYLCSTPLLDLNYVEDSAGGADVTVGILAKMDKVTLLQMDAKLPMDTFENLMELAIEGCKAIANYIWEVLLENTKRLECQRG